MHDPTRPLTPEMMAIAARPTFAWIRRPECIVPTESTKDLKITAGIPKEAGSSGAMNREFLRRRDRES